MVPPLEKNLAEIKTPSDTKVFFAHHACMYLCIEPQKWGIIPLCCWEKKFNFKFAKKLGFFAYMHLLFQLVAPKSKDRVAKLEVCCTEDTSSQEFKPKLFADCKTTSLNYFWALTLLDCCIFYQVQNYQGQ